MKIMLINASPRPEGTIATLAREVTAQLEQAGAEVEQLQLANCNIKYCTFCMTCYRDKDTPIGKCVLQDDMQTILPKLRAADGYVMATQVSSGHANAIFKTFMERCSYTAGSSKGKVLWLKGVPVTRFTDRQRYLITIAAAGTVPAWLRKLCDTATSQMKELGTCALNAKTVGTLYAGEITFKGLQAKDIAKARRLADKLAAAIESR